MVNLQIKEFAKVKGGKRLPKGHSYAESETEYPYLRVTDFGEYTIKNTEIKYLKSETQEAIKRYVILKDDIYISIAGTIGRVGWIPNSLDGANLTENAAKITEINGFYIKFLVYYLSSIVAQQQISEGTKATSQPKLALYRIEGINVPLFPLPIQRAIVSKIETLFSDLDNGIADLKKAQEQLKIYRQAVLNKALTGVFTVQFRKDNLHIESSEKLFQKIQIEKDNAYINACFEATKNGQRKPKDQYKNKKANNVISVLPLLPQNWNYYRLEDVTYLVTDGTHFTPKYMEYGIPFLSVKNVRPFYIRDEHVKYISREEHEKLLKRCKPEKDDILYTKVGATFGYACKVDLNYEFSIFVSLCLIKPVYKFFLSDFLEFLMNSELVFKQARQRVSGSGVPDLHLIEIRDFKIPLPPIEEQHQIVREIESRLSVCDKVEECIKQGLVKAQALRQSILKKAFEGKLLSSDEIEKCKAEEDYEPASVLLKRIRAERAAG